MSRRKESPATPPPAQPAEGVSQAIAAIEALIAEDPAGRQIAALLQPGGLERAARALVGARKTLIASGFFVPSAGAGESDGPPGAKALGEALRALGGEVGYVTDSPNAPLFQAIGAGPLLDYAPGLLARERPTHLVAIERLGRAADGRYYNMRGLDVSAHTQPVDELFLEAPGAGIVTVGIGDGGNEIGMGRVVEAVTRHVPQGARIASVVPTDHLIVAGVSNWGAYGLVGALALLSGRDLLPGDAAVRADAMAMLAEGGVDGVTLKAEPTFDGQPLERTFALLAAIRQVLADTVA